MTSLILFGAGASYGSEDPPIPTPPIGSGLFAELESFSPAAAAVPDDVKSMFRADFELGMAEYYARQSGNIADFQRELALYLCKFCPTARNAYAVLLRELADYDVIYSSLNYDLLFELSTELAGVHAVTYGLDEPEHHSGSYARILKIHGSANFWPDFGDSDIRGIVFEATNVDVVAPVSVLDPVRAMKRFSNHGGWSPVIAVYAEGKLVKTCPDFLTEQQRLWARAVEEVDRIFVVGVRVHRVDSHIWDTLGAADTAVTYFGRQSGRSAFDDWKSDSAKDNAEFIEQDFQPAIKTIVAKMSEG